MVGASSNPARASYFVATYLLSSSTDYTVWFVNPRETSILGRPVYPALADSRSPRTSSTSSGECEELPGVAADAVAVGARTFWAQLGLWSDEAAELAHEAGLRSSWTDASRSSTPASPAACTWPASTPGSSAPSGRSAQRRLLGSDDVGL